MQKKIFDAHLHCSENPEDILIPYARMNGLQYNLHELLQQLSENDVYGGLLLSPPLKNGVPLSNEKILELCRKSKEVLHPVFTVEAGTDHLRDQILLAKKNRDNLRAFKIRLGYLETYAYDNVFSPLYDYAESEDLPVMFHTGDTATASGSLQHSHPLTLDKLANGRESLKIVACHFGNPWIQDVAELIYKHENVFADISGLVAGAGGTIYSEGYLDLLARKLSEAAYYAGGVGKFIFGTDYPVETHSAAMKLVQKMKIDSSDLDNLLRKNAERLFKI